jgi:hypothetical protein
VSSDNPIAVAIVLPNGQGDARLVAGTASSERVVAFADDGAFAFDLPGDGEHWALVAPSQGAANIRISGRIGAAPVSHTESVEIPAAWRDRVYPVTLRAVRSDEGWTFERTLGVPLPNWDGPTGAGLAGRAEQIGLSAAALYLVWGTFLLAFVAAAVLRASWLKAARAR